MRTQPTRHNSATRRAHFLPMSLVRKPKRFRGKKASTTFSFSVDLTAWVADEAERLGINRSVFAEDLLEHAIDAYLAEIEAEKKKH